MMEENKDLDEELSGSSVNTEKDSEMWDMLHCLVNPDYTLQCTTN